MKIWPMAPVREKRRTSNVTVGWERMKERAEESALEEEEEREGEEGRRKDGVRDVGKRRARRVRSVEKTFMKNIIWGPSNSCVEKTWSCVEFTTPSNSKLIVNSPNPSKLLL